MQQNAKGAASHENTIISSLRKQLKFDYKTDGIRND